MSKFELINGSCADQTVDVVVNAANNGLWAGGGICGVIFKKAGMAELTAACGQYKTPLMDGAAVITPAFNLTNAKYIIHAVGPDFSRTPTAFKELFDAYYNSLLVMQENGLHSISFPLISSGIFGGRLDDPAGESAKQCVRAYKKFLKDYPEYDISVHLCAFTDKEYSSSCLEIKKHGDFHLVPPPEGENLLMEETCEALSRKLKELANKNEGIQGRPCKGGTILGTSCVREFKTNTVY